MRYLTAGESHGKAEVAILEGLPAGLKVEAAKIDQELTRRQAGTGRGRRMQIEKDKVRILSGLKQGLSLGSPVALLIENKDFSIERLPRVICPRPGHADLAGLLKYGFSDARNVLERASARETASRVAIGAVCKIFLREFRIDITSRVLSIGGESAHTAMQDKILQAQQEKDTVGGIFEVAAQGVPCGLGSYVQPDRRLDARLAAAIISIPGIKAIEFGLGFGYADRFGSASHDAIYYNKAKGYFRRTNNAGGIEGGISNGEDLLIRACMKPISTLLNPLDSVNIASRKAAKATVERSDTCVVEAAGVIAEAGAALVLADALLEKFGGDNLPDIKKAYQAYQARIR
ncbi:MAG: chorismate synthase [Candidatus Omnitrophica bacterium]|nr:chorismate synthase [Candidatus Omnitrophota bacterium]